MSGWTDDRVEALKRLWGDGYSASQIAAELGGVTRNAVIGKVHRLGLMTPRKPGAERPKRVERPKRQRPYTPKRVASGPAPDVAPIPLPDDAFTGPSGAPAAVMALKHAHCQWPLGDPRSPDFRYCGSDAVKGSSWCQFHQRMAVGTGTRSERDAVREAKRIAAWEARLADLVDAEHAAKRAGAR